MHKVGKTSSGKILVEMTEKEWKSVSSKSPQLSDLSDAIINFRFKHRLTQEALGKKLGLSRGTISSIERGNDQNINMQTYQRIVELIS